MSFLIERIQQLVWQYDKLPQDPPTVLLVTSSPLVSTIPETVLCDRALCFESCVILDVFGCSCWTFANWIHQFRQSPLHSLTFCMCWTMKQGCNTGYDCCLLWLGWFCSRPHHTCKNESCWILLYVNISQSKLGLFMTGCFMVTRQWSLVRVSRICVEFLTSLNSVMSDLATHSTYTQGMLSASGRSTEGQRQESSQPVFNC